MLFDQRLNMWLFNYESKQTTLIKMKTKWKKQRETVPIRLTQAANKNFGEPGELLNLH